MRSLLPLFATALALAAPALAAETVPAGPFRSLELRGGGEVTVRPGPVQRVTIVEGSSQISRFRVVGDGKLQIDVCDDNCPRQYRLRVEVESPHAPDVAIAGGGLIHAVGGFAPQSRLAVAIRGGGKIDMVPVSASSVSAAIHGGGLISVAARSTLAAAVNGGGEIRYSGNPRVSSAINGGGAVRRLD